MFVSGVFCHPCYAAEVVCARDGCQALVFLAGNDYDEWIHQEAPIIRRTPAGARRFQIRVLAAARCGWPTLEAPPPAETQRNTVRRFLGKPSRPPSFGNDPSRS